MNTQDEDQDQDQDQGHHRGPGRAASGAQAPPTVGVEEEYFLIHPGTHRMDPAGARVVTRASAVLGDLVSGEFTQYQIEGKTPPCAGPGELRKELTRVRAAAVAAAREEGLRLCASGTPVVGGGVPAGIGDHPRYRAGADQYRALLDDFAISAFHAHVHLPDREVAVLVTNHLRPWLPLLVAMSANSPFHQGRDTGYASWRAVMRSAFPCLGPPPYAASLAEHQRLAEAMAASEAMLEAGMPFWDVRLNPRLPTLEIRTMDVLPDIDDTVALTVLVRALVVTARDKAVGGDPGPRTEAELLRAAYWRAARDGWSGAGVDALSGQILPAPVQAERLVEYVRPALDAYGDTGEVTAFLRRLTERGCGARRQRAAAAAGGGPGAVVDELVAATAAGRWPPVR
ncbi:carboxylate-amine ligase [Streptomyces agglomeratus]|uniref:carboxylate-amine ligase n=1 Tax=Streptomyces agglomeratus TaxID=285458 RepID=UPI00099FEC8B|nr:glutamate--cysteine ligase [Streptomyces agglomeratus]